MNRRLDPLTERAVDDGRLVQAATTAASIANALESEALAHFIQKSHPTHRD